MKHLRALIILAFLTVCTVVFAPSAFALGESTTLTVKTVIDNASEYPTQVAGLSARYTASRIYLMKYSASTANAPSGIDSKVFDIVNNQSTAIKYNSVSGAKCDTFWFCANQYTDKHLSLKSVEYTAANNLKQYQYDPASSPNQYSKTPFNWVQTIDSKKVSSITLHFQYNPDIGSAAPDPDPDPSYTKTVDYLGDGAANPDTTVNGVNDYRLYLDLLTQQAMEDNKADIVFVLDVSGSMGDALASGQTKINLLRSTMTDAINNLTTNPNNRISIIKFSSGSEVLVSGSSNKNTLLNAVSSLTANGGTNYYASLADAVAQVNALTSSDNQNRDKVVIFLTDGDPTFASPAVETTTNNTYAGMIFACDSARKFSNVDKFYSVFIGDNSGSASTLQTITQMVPVSNERYMVQATNAQQLTDTFNRFMSKMSNSLYHVTLTDGLSDYVAYTGGLKVTKTTGSGAPVPLTLGADYSVSTGANGLSVTFLDTLKADTRYAMSFNVRSSDKALDEFYDSQSYPNLGDPGTDYAGNATSAGRAGFYSNSAATLKYSFGTSGSAEKAYNKPVVQVVEPAPISAEIKLTKVLNGMELKGGMFNFDVTQVTDQGDVPLGTVSNADDGSISFDTLDKMISISEPGTYTYKVKEVIPATPQTGMVYDTRTLDVVVTVTRANDALVTEVSYPSGQEFVNSYAPQPVYVTLEAHKELSGKPLAADMFSFSLLEGNGTAVDTQQNDALGNIQFKPLPFTHAGKYTYLIREAVPFPVDPRINYDLKTVTVTITVTDIGGVLDADVAYSPDATFRNEYVYAAADATVQVKKILTGMQLTTGMFKFELKNLDTGATMTESNLADGTVSFKLKYTTPGTHTYSIREITPTTPLAHMTYDTHTVKITVNVTDDGSGALTTTTVYPEDPNFYNSYQIRGGIW
ncbi:pilin isopeptide linkage domain-containing protein [Sporobacter termitidis DSM 10068]|uniref:Pilin isopeptide linkage domain-containing protein n=1 Tax=Sporobacter termitidis DSM 10068 TaxID=1123282 RepID=A0A1M5Z3S9_9FIRM|nr:FctA domain-containing protein [Sporobacter termitidis]SHI18895.1 pilin isopeptide linkage domain-containing protein [Sporobacter termitidis DSM 10068]